MADRVSAVEVKAIIKTVITDISAFITAANLCVTNWLGSSDLDDATLKEIERYLSAHMLSAMDPRAKEISIEQVTDVKYQGKWEMGLNGTTYGQMCILLDTTGTLDQLTRKGKTPISFGVMEYHDE